MNIAIQGISGSFHESAARAYFKNILNSNFVECRSFNDLFDALLFQKADYGVVAIENSLVGSILPNYTLLRESNLKILGEQYLRIEQHLVALPGQTINDIKEIYSHPMAIQQCQEFLTPYRRNGRKLIDTEDTAISARRIKSGALTGVAAICSKLAADLYGLEIIAEGIETNRQNFTRFLIISNEKNYQDHYQNKKINKSSICFTLQHQEGCLSQVLSVLAFYKMNLSKIQSIPIVGKDWEYLFYVDLIFPEYERYKQALDAIIPLTHEMEILGEYEKRELSNAN